MDFDLSKPLTIVAAIAAAIFVVFLILLISAGGFGFFASLFLSLLIAGLSFVVLYLGFVAGSEGDAATAEAPAPAQTDGPGAAAQRATEAAMAGAPTPAAEAAASAEDTPAEDTPGDGTPDEEARPAGLGAPRGGQADDLKKIRGVGPKLEVKLHALGIYHFDQIAAWGPEEVAWMDDNLEGFRGRVSRDNWVEQARTLAGGGATEFSRRVDEGDVY